VRLLLQLQSIRSFARQKTQGFTLLELLVVLVISGVLAAIALPSFLNQASKSKQVEAKINLGSINRAQQAYMMESSQFSDDLQKLGIAVSSNNYLYTIVVDGNSQYAVHHAESRSSTLKPYVGMAAATHNSVGELNVLTVLCEADQNQIGKAADPIYAANSVDCAPGTRSPR